MIETLQIKLSALLPDVPDANDACVHRLIGSLSAREGFEQVFVAEAAFGEPARLCIRYDPHVLIPSRIREIAEGISSSLRHYFCPSKENHKLTSRLP